MQPIEQSQRELREMGFSVSKESPANGKRDGYWDVTVVGPGKHTILVTAPGRERSWSMVAEAALQSSR